VVEKIETPPVEEKPEVIIPEKKKPEPPAKKKSVKPKKKIERPRDSKKTKKESIPEVIPVVKPSPKDFAYISFEETIHEFGEIDEGDKISHKFKFKNTGEGPLIIDNVDVSCGCTMPTYPIIPIGPGETGEIGVIYNSKGKFGAQKPSITVKTNASPAIVKLYLSGSIKHVFEKPRVDTSEKKDTTDNNR